VPPDIASGLAGGRLAGHSRAMIASNSALSKSSSAHTSSRNSSSQLRVSPTEATRFASTILTLHGHALMA
jgi:hypothetical protein